jgi:hypothetical protein
MDFEDLGRYTARPVKDRHDRPMLVGYLAANGILADDLPSTAPDI